MTVTFEKSEHEAPHIKTFYFKPEKPVRYTAGQFIELTLPHDQPDDRGIKRYFTLSSSPMDDLLTITTKIVSDNSSFKRTLNELKKGARVTMAEPMGDFVLPKDPSIPLVFVAGGMGITPYHSIFRWQHDMNETRDIRFLYAVSQEDDIIFQDTFDDVGVHATIIVSEPSSAWGGERGHLTAEHILKLAEPAPDALIYMAGPEPMIESLEKDLHKLDIPKQRLVLDFFPGYQPV